MILMAFQFASAAVMNVGATVVRPAPFVAFERGRIVVRAQGAAVSAEGGRVSRDRSGALVVTPEGPLVRVTLTY